MFAFNFTFRDSNPLITEVTGRSVDSHDVILSPNFSLSTFMPSSISALAKEDPKQ